MALSLAYYATAVAVYARLMMPTLPSVAVLWPPNVLLFVAFLLAPVRLWPLVIGFALATQLAVAATMDIPLGRSLGMFTGNLSQPIIAAAILRRLGQGERILETLRGATAFILVAALGAPAIASAVSAATLSATGWITDPWLHWRMRFVTNVLSTIVLAPPLLTFLRWRSLPRPLGPPVAEFLILLTCLTAGERLVNSLVTSVTFYPLLFAPPRSCCGPPSASDKRGSASSSVSPRSFDSLQTLIQDRRSSRLPMRSSRRSSRSSPSHCR